MIDALHSIMDDQATQCNTSETTKKKHNHRDNSWERRYQATYGDHASEEFLQNREGQSFLRGEGGGYKTSSRKNPYSPHERSSEIPRGRGVLKAQNFRSNMKLNWNFLGGGEVQNKNLPWGERATSFPGLFLWFKIFGEVLGTRLGEYGHFLELQIRQGFIWCRFSG